MTTEIQRPDYVRQRLGEIGFWFVDIPRTSSTAIRMALYQRYGRLFGKPSPASGGLGMGLIPPHVPAAQLKAALGVELWNGLYTFSIVRNPFERVLSLFMFLQRNGKLAGVPFKAYVGKLVNGGFDYHGHYLSNCGYVCDERGSDLVTDIFRFEDRESWLPVVAEKTGCPELLRDRPRVYESGLEDYDAHYDAESRRLVEDFFADDFQRFGFGFRKMA